MSAETTCASVWPAGLYGNLLIECDRQAKHAGKHARLDLTWTGKPLPTEESLVATLKAARS